MNQIVDHITEKAAVKVTVLKKRQDFLRVASGRKKWVSNNMIVQVAQTPEEANPDISGIRVGYTASKKVGNAVKRSRAKRRLREVVRQVLAQKGQRGHDYVLIARSVTVESAFDQLIRDCRWCLKRLNQAQDQNAPPKHIDKRRGKPDQSPSGRVNK